MKTLKDVKNSMAVSLAEMSATVNGVTIPLSNGFAEKCIIAGIYRQLSMDTAKGFTQEAVEKILARMARGYLTESEEKKAKTPLAASTSLVKGRQAFTRTEVIGKARDLTTDKKVLKTLDDIAAYDDSKWAALLLKVADKPESRINRAIAELTREKAEREAAELRKQMDEVADI